jgi:hypothetical protein
MTEGSELGSVSVRETRHETQLWGLPQSEQKRLRFVLLEAVVLCRENAYEYQRESYDAVRNVIDKNRGQGER